jgi:hypothetical protein
MELDRRFRQVFERARPRVVRIGGSGLELFSARGLAKGQVGYSQDPRGRDLTRGRKGAWRKTWLAIGYDTMCGDPILVDLAQPGWPVFTAMHGQGVWEPISIARSFEGFVQGMRVMKRASRGRSSPVALERKPLWPAERAELKNELQCLGGAAERQFWLMWFEA